MSTDKRYYLASGEVEQKVREFFKERASVVQLTREIAAKAGGHPVTGGSRMLGVYFDQGEKPDGWKYAGYIYGSGSYFMPKRHSQAGKSLFAEIEAVRIPEASELHAKVVADAPHIQGLRISWVTAEIVGGQVIVHVPAGMDYEPPGCRLLKNSEYWEIKEKQESKAA